MQVARQCTQPIKPAGICCFNRFWTLGTSNRLCGQAKKTANRTFATNAFPAIELPSLKKKKSDNAVQKNTNWVTTANAIPRARCHDSQDTFGFASEGGDLLLAEPSVSIDTADSNVGESFIKVRSRGHQKFPIDRLRQPHRASSNRVSFRSRFAVSQSHLAHASNHFHRSRSQEFSPGGSCFAA